MAVKKTLFLDRDGVINVDHGYVSRIEDFEFVDGILEFIKEAQRKGYMPIVITNQSGIGRGYYTQDDFERLTAHMIEKMQNHGIRIGREQIFHCPHDPDEGCRCRKPMPGMFLEAAERFDLDMQHSIMVGDKPSDIEAARAAGVGRVFLVEKNHPVRHYDIIL